MSRPRAAAVLDRRGFLSSLGVAGGALALAGCASTSASGSSSGSQSSSSSGTPAATSPTKITETEVNAAVGKLDGLAEGLLKSTGTPGVAVAVVHQGKTIYAKGFGVRKVGTKEPIQPDTVFELASVSKSVSATVVARMVSKNVVGWNDPLITHAPDFALADPWVTQHVTIGDLFSHRSGLPDHAGDLLEDLGFDQATILQRLGDYPLAPFRNSYPYTNFGLTAAANGVATAAGTGWDDLCQEQLYSPLGMSSTSSRFADYEAASNRASMHVRVGDTWEARYTRDADAQTPAGGVNSTVEDLSKWLRLMLAQGTWEGQELIDPKALLAAHSPQSFPNPPASATARPGFYGFGTVVGIDDAALVRASHSGGFQLGASTAYTIVPAADLGIVALTNGMPIGVPEAIVFSFLDLVESGKVQRDWQPFLWKNAFEPMYVNHSELAGKTRPSSPAPASALSSYTGTYGNQLYGTAQVTSTSGGGLVLGIGPSMTFPLTHWAGNTFSYQPVGENANGISAVIFTLGPGGQAASVEVENLNGETPATAALGTFQRS